MYVFPGKPLNVLIKFTVGGDPASPTLAAFRVVDADGEVYALTPITIPSGATEVWVSIPDTAHSLAPGEKYHQNRIEVTYTVNGLIFEEHMVYFVVPDLFLDFSARNARLVLGMSEEEFRESDVDFYRAYIDLASGDVSEAFLDALDNSDTSLRIAARQLIFWHTLWLMLPGLRMNTLKTVESETSKMTRMATSTNFDQLAALIRERYNLYLNLINTNVATAPVLLVLDAPTDAITGV